MSPLQDCVCEQMLDDAAANVFPSQVMEDTQAINWEAEEEEETERPSESLGCILEPLGQLHIFSSAHGPEKDVLEPFIPRLHVRTLSE